MKTTPATLRRIGDLVAAALVPADLQDALERVAARYAVALTPEMAAIIDPADPSDPIARQFMPDARELDSAAAENADPIGDHRYMPVKGIVHRLSRPGTPQTNPRLRHLLPILLPQRDGRPRRRCAYARRT